jgi:hypothetical protein
MKISHKILRCAGGSIQKHERFPLSRSQMGTQHRIYAVSYESNYRFSYHNDECYYPVSEQKDNQTHSRHRRTDS